MAEVNETPLPGFGLRQDFSTADGRHVGVLAHTSGRRDLLIYDEGDPDSCRLSITLDPDDARTLAELLGVPKVSEHLVAMQRIEGLILDWLTVTPSSPWVGLSIGDIGLRTRTGVSIVAVIRGADAIAAPGPEQVFDAGDVVVAVGTAEGIESAHGLLEGRSDR